MMDRVSRVVAFLLITACMVATGGLALAKASQVSLGMLPVVDNLPFYVAEREGLFRKHGVEVRLVPFASAVERDTALRVGAIDGGLADVIMAALMEGTGTDVSIVSLGLGASPSEGRFALLGAPGGDVKSVKDLKGRSLAISGNTIIEYVADEIIRGAGLKATDVEKIEIPKLPVRLEMLLSGRLEAAVLPDPMATYAQARGARLIADDTKADISQTVMVFRADALGEKAASVKQLLAAYAEAADRINASPEGYRGLLADTANVPESIRRTYQIDHYPSPQMPTEDYVEKVLAWMVRKRLLPTTVTYGQLVEAGFAPKKKR